MKKIDKIKKRYFVIYAVIVVLAMVVFGVSYPWVSWKQALVVSFGTIVCSGVCAYIGYRIGSKIMK